MFKYFYVVLAFVIGFLLIIFYYGWNVDVQSRGDINYSAYGDSDMVHPIEKTQKFLDVEETLLLEREISLRNNVYTIKATLRNFESLDDDIVIEDFVDELRFDKRVKFKDVKIDAKNGFLFPPGDDVKLSSYGSGPRSSKKSNLNIVLLDLKLDKDSKSTDLYEMVFELDRDAVFDFASPEVRSQKYILDLRSENNWIS